MFKIQIKLDGVWCDIHQPNRPPYLWPKREDAERMLEMCYPDQMREQRLYAIEFGRVTEVDDVRV